MAGITEEEFLELTNAHTPKTFSLAVERMARESEIGYLDAIIEYANDHNIEMDIVPKLITKLLHKMSFREDFFVTLSRLSPAK